MKPATQAAYYLEIDDENAVIRQVETACDQYLWGKWTGAELVGHISDQPITERELEDSRAVTISSDEFESVWRVATAQ